MTLLGIWALAVLAGGPALACLITYRAGYDVGYRRGNYIGRLEGQRAELDLQAAKLEKINAFLKSGRTDWSALQAELTED